MYRLFGLIMVSCKFVNNNAKKTTTYIDIPVITCKMSSIVGILKISLVYNVYLI